MPTVICPGCGREIRLPANELSLPSITCARCDTAFVPSTGQTLAPVVPDDSPAEYAPPPPPVRRGALFVVGGVVALTLLLILIVAAMQRGPAKKTKAEQDREDRSAKWVNSIELWNQYRANAAKADLDYKGQRVVINGRISEINSDSIGFGVVAGVLVTQDVYDRMTAQEKRWYNEGYPANIVCRFDSNRRSEIAGIKKDSMISINGRVVGMKKDPEVWMGQKILLEDCWLADPAEK
ncbi:MAG: hypothetical protein HYS12_02450 [Planctomycetes bacterium]|nr:hypothetical protein [Planctomycetota bacterium]